jgi:CHRD domain
VSASCRRSGVVAACLVIMLLGIVGCAGSGSSTSASRSSAPLHVYRVRLTGKAQIPKGAASGTGYAIIAIHPASVVCWRFAHLHGFFNATVAQIHAGGTGTTGRVLQYLSTGPRLHHQGCVKTSAAAVTAISRDPSKFYVNVHSQLYPAGAVRGQL